MSIRQIIDLWPTRRVLAEDVGADVQAVHSWWHRQSIPARYFVGIVAAAERRGIAVGYEALALAHAAPSRAAPSDEEAA